MKYTVEITDKQQTIINAIEPLLGNSFFKYGFSPDEDLGNGQVKGYAEATYRCCMLTTINLSFTENVLRLGSWEDAKYSPKIFAEFDEIAPKIIAVAEALDSTIKVIHTKTDIDGESHVYRNDISPDCVTTNDDLDD